MAVGVHDVEYDALPPEIKPEPDTPATAVVHVLLLYSVNVTEPVGLYPLWNVAVSPTVVAVPTTMSVVGDACVVIVGDALITCNCSLSSRQPVVKPSLL